ncbi:MAG: TRAP transporter small permease [Sneathiellaceae bacterium]
MFEAIAIRLPRLLGGLCLLAGVGINFANIVGRFFFGAPIFWAEEAMIFLVLWAVFLTFISVTASRAHLNMDLFQKLLPRRAGRALELAGLAVGVVAMGYLALQSWSSLQKLWSFDMRSISLQIPMVVPHAAVLVGFAGSAAAAFILIWKRRE